MIKILIGDDHAIVRRGLKQIVEESSDMVVDEAKNGQEVLEKTQHTDYDILVLDISLPDRSGLDILKHLKKIKPELPILILSIHPEEQYAVRVLKAGASGYLSKDSVPNELLNAIRKVSQGGKYVTSSLAERLVFNLEKATTLPLHETLSDREFQVMCLIASGLTVKQIAEKLYLSVKTISTYRSRILEKMNLKNNAEITHYAIKNELVE
jgi:DNA-binding NarL/FixJ family response regulator